MLLELVLSYQLELVRESLTGTHCRYREYLNGIPTERYETRPCSGGGGQAILAVQQSVETGALRRLWVDGRLVRREIAGEHTLAPFAEDYDVETGELVRRIPLYFQAKPARVFDPNPVVALNDPALQDRNDDATAVPPAAYRDVELERTAELGPLRGSHVTLVDRQLPAVEPPDVSESLVFDRAHDGFEAVQAYFHVDRNQEYLQSLGYRGARGVVAYAIEVDAHAVNGNDNSVFLPNFNRIGFGSLYFGDGGTDDAEDADLIVHEYGHAILEWIAPGTFSGGFGSEARAMGEGFGDYWAFSAHRAQRAASGRDPYCFADWDARCWEDDPSQQCSYRAGSDCLRRLDSTRTMAEYERIESPGAEHRNGTIWSSALREIHEQAGRETTDRIVIESIFGVPPHPTFAMVAQRMIEADRLLHNGTNTSVICSAMMSRGILEVCDLQPRGAQTLFQSTDFALAIPEANSAGVTSTITIDDPRTIEQLFVRVDIEHATRGDLQIELVAPDGTVIRLQQISLDRGPDIHATYGLTAVPVEPLEALRGRSAAGTWKLIVRDLRLLDTGVLQSWGLLIRFAGEEPVTQRPRHARAQMLPVVTHVFGGADDRPYVSDVRVANVRSVREKATLIFTRSGENGLTAFSAVDVNVEPGQTLAFDDIVATLFHTAGSGTLEILGDVIVMSRTYAITAHGTLGQQVPPNLDTTEEGESPITVAPFDAPAPWRDRVNVGIAETAGGSGTIRLLSRGETRDIPIAPFSHAQFPGSIDAISVTVVSGDARVAAYVSQLDAFSKDPMFIPAQLSRNDPLIAPFITAPFWQSAIWGTSLDPLIEYIGEVEPRAVRVTRGSFTGSRVRHGSTNQYVPLLPAEGPRDQHLLFLGGPSRYRTNIGIVSDGPATAAVTVYDAAGNDLGTGYLRTGGGVHQVEWRRPPGVNAFARAHVRFLFGHGRAYASIIDTGSGDATYVQGQ